MSPVPLRRRPRSRPWLRVYLLGLTGLCAIQLSLTFDLLHRPSPDQLPALLVLTALAGLSRQQRIGPFRLDAGRIAPALFFALLLLTGPLPAAGAIAVTYASAANGTAINNARSAAGTAAITGLVDQALATW